jgi:hypothetical protein
MLRTTCLALTACFVGSAAAENPARPDPADPKAGAPLRPYESAFKGYRPYVDPEVARWRDANEEMGRLGGHLGHVPRESGAIIKPGAKLPPPAGQGAHK